MGSFFMNKTHPNSAVQSCKLLHPDSTVRKVSELLKMVAAGCRWCNGVLGVRVG